MKSSIIADINDSIATKQQLLAEQTTPIEQAAKLLIEQLHKGNKVLFCGNGGSAADSQHLATELVVRLRGSFERPSIPALALTTDTSLLTAAANDYGYDHIFSRQIEGLGHPGDVLLAFSTSGNSSNVIHAVAAAKKKQIPVIGMLGQSGGKLKDLVNIAICVPHTDSGRIQESHIMIGHILCRLIEENLYNNQ
jgi:D-sedoheptulose 7-phosphate isomerase